MVTVQEVLGIAARGQMGYKHHPDPRSFASLRMTICGPGQMGFRLLPGSFASLRMTVGGPGHKGFSFSRFPRAGTAGRRRLAGA